jgi:hypothetical protein
MIIECRCRELDFIDHISFGGRFHGRQLFVDHGENDATDRCLCSMSPWMRKYGCDKNGRVTRLTIGEGDGFNLEDDFGLSNSHLTTSSIHSAIRNLNALTSLELNIPAPNWIDEVSALRALKVLVVNEPTKLHGAFLTFPSVPHTLGSVVGMLSTLESISINSRSMLTLPSTIGLLPRLSSLNLYCPSMNSLPAALGALTSLSSFLARIKPDNCPRSGTIVAFCNLM